MSSCFGNLGSNNWTNAQDQIYAQNAKYGMNFSENHYGQYTNTSPFAPRYPTYGMGGLPAGKSMYEHVTSNFDGSQSFYPNVTGKSEHNFGLETNGDSSTCKVNGYSVGSSVNSFRDAANSILPPTGYDFTTAMTSGFSMFNTKPGSSYYPWMKSYAGE